MPGVPTGARQQAHQAPRMTATDIRTPDIHTPDTSPEAATAWTRRLAAYRSPIPARSLFELAVTVFPFLALFALSWAALAISPWLSVALSLANAAFVVRLFMIQHDCGHGAFFRSRRVKRLGRARHRDRDAHAL